MRSAFLKDLVRSIRGSLGRFLAIMGISALGCGFFAGLQMSGPDMRAAGDAFYDGTSLYDIRLVSTLGFTSDDVGRIAAVEGAGAVMPAITCDVMARLGQDRIAVRISSLDVSAARRSEEVSEYAVASGDSSYLNRLMLREGRWPTAPGECVITADKDYPPGFGVGDTVEVLYGTTDVDELLATRTFTVVGRVSSSYYPYTGSFGSTSLGSGMIGQYMYVSRESFTDDAPFTEVYVQVPDALPLESGSDEYQAVVGEVKDRYEGMAEELADARLADIRADAQAILDEKRAEYESERADAEAQLADARAELDVAAAQLEDARAELDSAAARLEDALAQLAEGERQIADGERQIADAERQIARGQAEYERGVADLEQGRRKADAQLAEGQAQIDAGVAELEDAEAQFGMTQEDIDAAYAQLAEGEAEWNSQRSQLVEMSSDLGTCISTINAIVALSQVDGVPTQEQIDATRAQVEAGVAAARDIYDSGLIDFESDEVAAQVEAVLAEVRADLDGIVIDEDSDPEEILEQLRAIAPAALGHVSSAVASAQAQVDAGIASGDAQVAEARSQIDLAQAARDQLDDGWAQIDEARAELEQGRADAEAQLAAGQRQLDDAAAQLAYARSQIPVARARIDAARAELEQGRRDYEAGVAQYEQGVADYEEGLAEYEDGLAEWEKARAEADAKFADAEAQLADAQREIDELEAPDIYALDRSQSEGAVTYNDDTLRMDSIADVFPFIFFLVAALVSLTTMTRMVEDDRILIGTYKALGYSKAKIASKYLAYAGLAGGVGAVVGILVLSQVLPFIVIISYAIIYAVPIHTFPMPVSLPIALLSGGLGVGVTLVATWGAVVSSLTEVPATLMLPKAPSAGKRILLEHVGPIWRRLSFSWKVTCRNIFRYKRRLAMTVIGISGCTALLLTGFGLHDAIWDIIDNQYGPIIHYDTTIGLDDNAIGLDADRVEAFLDGREGVSGVTRVQVENMQAGAADYDGALSRVQVVVPRSADELAQAITFHNRLGDFVIDFDDNAVIITEKLSMKLGIGVGDEVLVYDQDTVGNAVGEGHALTVTGVAENYVGNYVYVGRSAWATVDSVPPVFQTLLASVPDVDNVREQLSDDLQDMDDVSTVIFSDETINLYRSMLKVVDLIVVVLIVSAAALAFIVLYNLTNINVSERVREIASLKVLGFTRGEVYSYIFREIALLAVLGDALGMVLGTYLAEFVITTAEVDYVMFGRTIHPPSYLYSFVLTLVFTALVLLIMRHKLDHVNMVESLKSVE